MNDLVPISSTPDAIQRVRDLEAVAALQPQLAVETGHLIHGGMYARTVIIRAGTVITGALIKKATILILSGIAKIFTGAEPISLNGYQTLAARAYRKSAFHAIEDTYLTMIFPTNAKTVEEAEAEFTDEFDLLSSRDKSAINHIVITGE